MRKLITSVLCFAVVLLAQQIVLAADDKKPSAPSAEVPDPVAVVNGTPIPKSMYEAYAQQRHRGIQGADTPEARKTLTDELVLQELLVQEADKQHLEKDAQFVQQMALVKRNLLASVAVRKYLSEHPITDEAIQKEYEASKAGKEKKEYKARHILVDSKEKAEDIIKQIKGGGDFSALAKEKSSDSSKTNGGDLGWFTTDMMVEPFGEAVTKLEKGKYTQEPVQTQFGWHIIMLDDVRDAAPPSMEEMRPQISQMLQGQLLNEYLEKLRAGAKVEIK